jgi:hypothetical protein
MSVVISAKIESEIAMLPPDERADYLAAVGLKETGLDRLVRAGYALLHSSPISPPVRRRRVPGPSQRVLRAPRRPA